MKMKRIIAAILAVAAAAAFASVITPTSVTIRAYKGAYIIGPAFTSDAACEAYVKTQPLATNYKCRKDTGYKVTTDPVALTVTTQLKLATATPALNEVVPITPAVWSAPVTNRRWILAVPSQGTYTLTAASFIASWEGAAGTISEQVDYTGGTATSLPVAFQTSTGMPVVPPVVTPPPGGSIPTQTTLSARLPFSSYPNGITVQNCGNFPPLNQTSESAGIVSPCTGTVLGKAMRFGKVDDPKGSGRKVFRHALKASDPQTGPGVHRVDIIPPNAGISLGTTYWLVWDMLLPANTYTANDWTTLVNIHPGGSVGSVGVQINKGQLTAVTQTSSGNTYWNLTSTSLADQWIQMAVKVRLASDSSGLLQIWVNGVQKVNHSGATAPSGASGDYVKLAFYNYSFGGGIGDMSRPEREMFYGSFHVVRDAGYTLAQVTALLQ